MAEPEPFEYDGGRVEPGEQAAFRYPVSQTYLGDQVRLPVTVINGERAGPTLFLSAAVHGDELNGIEVVREVAEAYAPADVAGTLVCLPVINVPGFLAQKRYLPIYERDLNRAFPGDPDSTSARRIAHKIFTAFVEPCDLGVDFHTSTRGRTNMFHVRADVADEATARLANAFGTSLIIDGEGPEGSLRREAKDADVPTVTIEMGEAHRFQRDLIDRALAGVESVLAEYGIVPANRVRWPGWRTVIGGWSDRTWLRADEGGIVEMHFDRGDLVREGETVASLTDPFGTDRVPVEAPFTGLVVGILENPVVYPGNPLCHLVAVDDDVEAILEQRRGIDDELRA